MRSLIHIGTSEPVFPDPEELPEGIEIGEGIRDTKLWWNPDTGLMKQYNSDTGEYDIDVVFINPNGLSGSKVVSGKRLTFTNGLLTGFEDA